jgi:hypothetical protein
MLRACVLPSKGSWESWLPLAEFTYNNSYQGSIKMTLFKALYGRKYRTPLNWVEPRERRYYSIDFVEEVEEKGLYYPAKHERCKVMSEKLCG